jgi:hypothetical protein
MSFDTWIDKQIRAATAQPPTAQPPRRRWFRRR